SGSSHAGSSENRRRTRYAVLSALHVLEYVPEDPEHMGLLKDESPPVPFEVYRHEGDGRKVMVLWIQEEGLGDHPLQNLGGILSRFGCLKMENLSSNEAIGLAEVKFIGSDSLWRSIQQESPGKNAFYKFCRQVEFHVPNIITERDLRSNPGDALNLAGMRFSAAGLADKM